MDNLQKIYLVLLGKMWNIEDSFVTELAVMAKRARSEALRDAFTEHLAETKEHRKKVEQVCATYSFDPTGTEDVAFQALLEGARDEVEEITDPDVADAFLIASAQTVEHIEIAKYSTLIDWSKVLKDDTAEDLLKEILDEEKAAQKKLKGIAVGGIFTTGINEDASK